MEITSQPIPITLEVGCGSSLRSYLRLKAYFECMIHVQARLDDFFTGD